VQRCRMERKRELIGRNLARHEMLMMTRRRRGMMYGSLRSRRFRKIYKNWNLPSGVYDVLNARLLLIEAI
jgi:hypothetical protein